MKIKKTLMKILLSQGYLLKHLYDIAIKRKIVYYRFIDRIDLKITIINTKHVEQEGWIHSFQIS